MAIGFRDGEAISPMSSAFGCDEVAVNLSDESFDETELI